ncbi:MAG TPA: hypothetical protein VJ964_04200 [Balneolaceae bacterium]|nr:hypothetical protein [Balneolaceae bacterium]
MVFREGGVFSVPEKTPPDPIWSENGLNWPTLLEEGLWGSGDQEYIILFRTDVNLKSPPNHEHWAGF